MQKNAHSPVKFRHRDTAHVEDLGKGSKSCSLAHTPRADKSSLTIQGRVWAKRHKQWPCFVPRTLKQEVDIFKTEQILNCGNNWGSQQKAWREQQSHSVTRDRALPAISQQRRNRHLYRHTFCLLQSTFCMF